MAHCVVYICTVAEELMQSAIIESSFLFVIIVYCTIILLYGYILYQMQKYVIEKFFCNGNCEKRERHVDCVLH